MEETNSIIAPDAENDSKQDSSNTSGKSNIKENVMGTMECGKLLLTISLPMMMSMLVQALYNIVDSVFVSRVSESALTAVSLAFPIQSLMISIATGTGVGINSRLSRKLGEKRWHEVNQTAGNAVFLAVVYSLLFFVLGLTICGPYYRMMTSDVEIVKYGVEYTSVILLIGFGLAFQVVSERLLQSTGKTIYSMVTQMTGAILNIILDPIMIFGLLGFPALGTMGAAVATVTGQTVAAILGMFFNLRLNKEISFRLKYLVPHKRTIKEIYAVGVPSIFMQSIGSVMNLGMNKILLQFSSTAAAAFGIYYKLQSFVFMPIFGMNNGVVPIIAYNFGAKKPDRIKEVFKLAIKYAICIMACGTLVFELIPGPLLSIFDASENLYAIGKVALRVIAIHFVIAGYCIIAGSMMQALGHGGYSLIVSLTRQLAVLLPAAYILAKVAGLNFVWLAFPIAEVASFIVSSIFIRKIMKMEINTLYDAVKTSA